MSTTTLPYVSVGGLGDTLGVQSWRIARLFELGILSEPPRIGRRRLIPKSMIPLIVDALRTRGWLPPSADDPEQEVSHAN
jgi:hypothetical protein